MYAFVVSLLHPFTLLFLACDVCVIVLWSRRIERRRALTTLTVCLAVLQLFCTPVVAYLCALPLEAPLAGRARRSTTDEPGAIVVLSGGPFVVEADDGTWLLDETTRLRCLHAAEVARRTPGVPIVVSGGMVGAHDRARPTAPVMRDLLVALGVNADDVIVEDRSTNTTTNATESAKLLNQRGIDTVILVSNATHLYRATLCFERAGLTVIPDGCCSRTGTLALSVFSFLPRVGAAKVNQEVVHEALGLVWYRLRGRL
jgi:uncharacterized SAM-binding protein YcdF (DUF218 family)